MQNDILKRILTTKEIANRENRNKEKTEKKQKRRRKKGTERENKMDGEKERELMQNEKFEISSKREIKRWEET